MSAPTVPPFCSNNQNNSTSSPSFLSQRFNMTVPPLVMVNYACGFAQSETGKYFEWIINICYSPARRLGGPYWEKLFPRSWVPRAQFLPIRTDLGRWITFFFFLLKFKSFRKILLQPPIYVGWRRTRSFRCYSKCAIDCKPKQNITTWFLTCNLYYHN